MVALVILDGFGISSKTSGNAVSHAKTPNFDNLNKTVPHSQMQASGLAVGIDEGQMGNSECGHINIGAGRIVKQNSVRFDELIDNGDLKDNKTLNDLVKHSKDNNSNVHLMGLYSKGGVHSKIKHVKALISYLEGQNLNVILHLFTDGRDRPVDEAKAEIEELLETLKTTQIGSVCGRVWAMDREKRYDRIKKCYQTLTRTGSFKTTDNVLNYLTECYAKGEYDEFIEPACVSNVPAIKDNDSVLFFNFRTDRPRELTEAFTSDEFNGFKCEKLKNLYFATLTNYSKDLTNVHVLMDNEKATPSLGEIISRAGLKQFRISESTKYAHITFFINGEREQPFAGETRKLIETKNVISFDKDPKMQAAEITKGFCDAIESKQYDFCLANLTNCDMVGHTGNMQAGIVAVETIDDCIGRIVESCRKNDCDLIITADHGNIEMLTDGEQMVTSHTCNPVPLYFISNSHPNAKLQPDLPISSIAPTVLHLLGVEIPNYMTTPIFLKK